MQYLFEEVASLDRRCYESFRLSEEILMEHAADGMADYIHAQFDPGSSITIVCGPGNNGADGIVLARLLHGDYDVTIALPYGAKSPLCTLQLERAEALGITAVSWPAEAEIVVDALFGTGFTRAFDNETIAMMGDLNAMGGYKIACDMPTGLHPNGSCEPESFYADVTLTMGALKRGMFSDAAKELVGDIIVLDLGVARSLYETESRWMLLDPDDLELPLRRQRDTHKGSYGHLAVICGEKEGAGVIAGSAALRFGAGLVTLISNEQLQLPHELMQSHLMPATASAIALGMGLGQEYSQDELDAILSNPLPLVVDADVFAHPMLLTLLKRDNVILTPHPKEFTNLLRACGIADIDVATLQKNRFVYVEAFATAYPDVTLLLKGANVIIASEGHFYVNPHGTGVLAKGGSGDVLAGLTGALLAQGYTPHDAAINASLAHTAAATAFEGNNYALTPLDLIGALPFL